MHQTFKGEKAPALYDINLNFPKGEIIGLVGPDGAGKTTLIRLIAGLLLPSQGDIYVANFNTKTEAEKIHQIIGYMPQKFGLYEDLTVMQNLNLYADLRKILGKEREETFKRLLSFTNLSPFTDRLAGRLSGGMKQKLGLACALIKKPSLLLLDEPSVGVDPISRRELWKMVEDLVKEGISVLWSTAYLDEAEKCKTTLLLNQGRLLFQGPPQEMTDRVQGRAFKIIDIKGNRRKVLEEVLKNKNVIDGIIQGSDVRFVTRNKSETVLLKDESMGKIIPTTPRFEDAFIDALGGGPGGGSLLADKSPEVPLKRSL